MEATPPTDDPLSFAGSGGRCSGEAVADSIDDEPSAGAVDASQLLALEDETLRVALGYGAEGAVGEEEGIFATLLEDEGGSTSPFLADGTTAHELRRQCLLTSNATAARRHLEELATYLEDSLEHGALEQRQIIAEPLVIVFSRLRKVADDKISGLLRRVLTPLKAYLLLSNTISTAPQHARSGNGHPAVNATETVAQLARTYARGLSWMRRYLGADVLERLLQRAWTEALAALLRALSQHLFIPREIGDKFATRALALLDELSPVLHCEGDGPSVAWLSRRAAPLRATLELTKVSTTSLLQQYRIQPPGPKRTAALAALALRMDDREAAALVYTMDQAELRIIEPDMEVGDGCADQRQIELQFSVDGIAALEAISLVRKL